MKKNLCIFLVLVLFLSTIFAAGNSDRDTVTVNGTGVISAQPDIASITLAVNTTNNEVEIAANENATIMTQVQEAILLLGIEKENITTENYTINPQYNWDNNKQIFDGYKVRNRITIEISDFTLINKVIDTATSKGVNEITRVSFSVKDTNTYYKNAREIAVQNALDKANSLAQLTNRKLGKAIEIEEYSDDAISREVSADMVMMSGKAATNTITPINPEKTQIIVNVRIIYELQ